MCVDRQLDHTFFFSFCLISAPPNKTYQTKHIKQNISNKTYQTKHIKVAHNPKLSGMLEYVDYN